MKLGPRLSQATKLVGWTMNKVMLGALVGAGLAIAALTLLEQRNEVFAQRISASAPGGGELFVFPTLTADKAQLLTVVDPRLQTLAVYQVELPTGKIKLLSVRAIRWDLQMTYLNNEKPLPQEIHALLEQR